MLSPAPPANAAGAFLQKPPAMVADLQHFQQRLASVQETAARLRCEAFVDYTPVVAGQRLLPVTLPSYNRLCAFGCAFVTGAPVAFADLVCFVWVHHPEFGQFNARAKTRVTHAVWRALHPRFDGVQGILRFITPLPRFRWLARFHRPMGAELRAVAVADIRRLLHEALHDFPPPAADDAPAEPLPFAFQAQILNLFRRSLGLGFDDTRSMPLKQVAQHLREALHHASGGKAQLLTRDEAAVWADYLAWKQSLVTRNTAVAVTPAPDPTCKVVPFPAPVEGPSIS